MVDTNKNVVTAFNQWKSRPAEERFIDIDQMQAAMTKRRERCEDVGPYSVASMKVEPGPENSLALVDGDNGGALLNNFSLNQLAASVKAPAGYLRTLPNHLAADCLNEGLPEFGETERHLLYEHGDQVGTIRAITSPQYSRYWDNEVIADLANSLQADGWRVPPCRPFPGCPENMTWTATENDILPGDSQKLSIRQGDLCGPGGLYSSDRDSFVFMVNQDRTIETPSGPMFRALICKNSEVGQAAFGISCFLYSAVCGNHIMWGAAEVADVKIRHRGEADLAAIRAKAAMAGAVAAAENASTYVEETTISLAAETITDSNAVQQATKLPKDTILAAETLAKEYPQDHGDRIGTTWAWVQGLTRASQQRGYTADRASIDAAAANLLKPIAKQVQYAAA